MTSQWWGTRQRRRSHHQALSQSTSHVSVAITFGSVVRDVKNTKGRAKSYRRSPAAAGQSLLSIHRTVSRCTTATPLSQGAGTADGDQSRMRGTWNGAWRTRGERGDPAVGAKVAKHTASFAVDP